MKANMKSTLSFSRVAVAGLCLLTLAAITPLYAADTNENHGQFSASDYKFACAAATGGKLEVNLGNIASQKSTDPAIQQFGQKMAQDHGKAGDQLQQIASQKGATLPADITAAQQKHVDRLNGLSGSDFDKAYIDLMVKAHKADLKAFQHASENAQDSDLKTFAANTIPMIQDHLKMAEDLKAGNKVAATDTK